MSGILNKEHIAEYVYDFSVDGGANGTAIDLHDKAGKSVIPVGAIITDVVAKVVTACTSDGSATVAWGNGDNADGYSGTTIAVGSLTDNSLWHKGVQGTEALIWDNTNDAPKYVNVADAADGQLKLLISDADLTAGKIVFVIKYYLPTLS